MKSAIHTTDMSAAPARSTFPFRLFSIFSRNSSAESDFEPRSDEQDTCKAQTIPPSIAQSKAQQIKSKCPSEASTPHYDADLKFEQVARDTYAEKETAGLALLRAVRSGDVAAAQALLQGTCPGFASASVSVRTAQRETLLHAVSRSGCVPLCQLLLDYGIMPEGAAANHQGQTPLHLASHFGHFSIVRLLVKAGADLGAADYEGNTPLHCAALARHYDVTKFLRLSGANANARNKQGRTANDCQSMTTLVDLRKSLHVPSIRTVILPSRKSEPLQRATPQARDFEVLGLLGEGSFGEVYLVREPRSGQKYALKGMKKGRVLAQKMTKYAVTERNVLCRVQSPFIVGLHSAFQNSDSLFLLLDYCPGGDLSYYLAREKRFTEHKARLYACELVLALEELHRHDIIYRDLKPSNVVLTAEGHIQLTDFGLAKEGVSDNYAARSFCGSLGYLAPEMLKKQGHGKAADWYMLGTLLYELLTGCIPYFAPDQSTILRNMETGTLSLPMSLSAVTKDFLSAVLAKQLLCKDPKQRLGSRGAEDIKAHPFFASVSWTQVLNKELKPPKPGHPDLFARPVQPSHLRLESSEPGTTVPGWEFVRDSPLTSVC